MADAIPWLLVAIGVLLVLFLVVALWRWKYGKKPLLDYKTLFYVGLVWLAIGLPLGMIEIWLAGLLFIAVGLAKRGEWKSKK